jgi:hypothetical protein
MALVSWASHLFSSLDLAMLLIEHLVLCLKINMGLAADSAMIS